MLEIRFLGQFDLRIDGKSIDLTSRPGQALMAFLVLNPGVHHRREKVAGILWPDIPETKARSRLRYALWQLRNAIGEPYLLTDKISVMLDREAEYWSDIAELDTKLHPGSTADEILQIVSVFKGELLPGFYEEWISLERERLQATFDNKLELLLYRLIEEKRWREILEWGEQWISLGQTPEPAYRALMIAHHQLGDISSAINTYQRCVQTLREQLDVDPSEETQREYKRIVNGDSLEIPGGKSTGISVSKYPSSFTIPDFPEWEEGLPEDKIDIFVSREHELSRLDTYLKRSLAGQGLVVFISGDTGRGKTALVHEFGKRAQDRLEDLIVVQGSCEAQTGMGDPLLPFRDVAALLFGDIESKWIKGVFSYEGARRLWELFPTSVQALIENGPDLVDTFVSGDSILNRATPFGSIQSNWIKQLETNIFNVKNKPTPLHIQHSDIQKDLFNQYTKVLQQIAQEHPLMIILDDLQWADLASISLLFHLGRRITNNRILIVGIFRSVDIAPDHGMDQHPLVSVITELKRTYGENEINLDQLDESENRDFVDSFIDTEPNSLSEEFRQTITLHTGGHPLFTIELLRQMRSVGDLQKDEQGQWVESPSIHWDSLPARVEAVIAGRVTPLSNNLKEILRIASIEGEEFTAEVIAQVTKSDISSIIHQLSVELDKNHMLVAARGIRRIGDQRLSHYVFRHHLFYKYVYDTLDSIERVHLHEKVGKALETLYKDQADQIAVRLARHFEEAGLSEKAIDYLLQAGDKAKRLSVNEEAISHLSRGLEILQKQTDIKDRFRRELALQIALSAPLVATRGYTSPEAERTFERARELCDKIDDKTQLATVLWGLWSFYLVRAKYLLAHEMAEQILSLAESGGDASLLLVAKWTLGITLVHLGRCEQAQEHLDTAIELYDPEVHLPLTYLYGQNPAVTCKIYSAISLWFLGFPNQSQDRCNSAIQLAEEITHPYSQAFAYGMAGILYAQMRDVHTSLQYAQKAFSLSKQEGFPFLLALGMTIQGWGRSELGKTSMTVNQMRRGINGMKSIGAEIGRPIFLTLMAEAHRKSGLYDEGLTFLEEAFQVTQANQEYLNESDLWRLKGELLELQGAPGSDISNCFYEAIEIARHQNAKLLELRAVMALYNYQQKHGLPVDTKNELAEIYGWFPKGLDMIDIIKARDLLQAPN